MLSRVRTLRARDCSIRLDGGRTQASRRACSSVWTAALVVVADATSFATALVSFDWCSLVVTAEAGMARQRQRRLVRPGDYGGVRG